MGKTLTVTEFDLQFGKDDHKIDVYAVFKEEKRGEVLAIYSDRNDENKAILHYGSVHMKDQTIVFIDIKNKEEIIKEFTWKLLNKRENEGFQVYDISNYTKAEIVSSNQLLIKPQVIKTLYDMNVPKEIKNNTKKKKKGMSSSSKILFTGFSLAFLVTLAFLFFNKDLLLGTSIKFVCTNSYLDADIGSTKEMEQSMTFNIKNELTSRIITTRYKFNNKEEYQEYVNIGAYFKDDPIFMNSSLQYEHDDVNLIFSKVESVLIDELYNGKNTKDELIKELEEQNYQCVDVSE